MCFFNKDNGHLAKTRKEQFGYIIRNNASSLFFSNLFAFLFLSPLIATFIFSSIFYKSLVSNESSTNITMFTFFTISSASFFISILVWGIGLAGLYQNIYDLVFLSSTKVSSFFKGIKRNFKSFFKIHLVFSLIIAFLILNIGFYLYIPFNGGFKLAILIINCFLLFSLLIGKGMMSFEATSFNNKLIVYIRNSVYLFYKMMPSSLLVLMIILIPIFAIFFVPIQFVFIPIAILATFYISIASLGIFILTLSKYEKLFDKEQIKEIYHKGLEDINL